MHLANIPEMKSISKPRLPIEIYTFQEIMSTEEFRKKCFLVRLYTCCKRKYLLNLDLEIKPFPKGVLEISPAGIL
jgi:hypothetical protein